MGRKDKTKEELIKEIKNLRRQVAKLEKTKTKLKLAQKKQRQYFKSITFLTKTAMKFVEFPSNKDIYRFIGECLKKLVPYSMVFINSYDQTTGIIRTRLALGIGTVSEKTLKLLGRYPVGMTFKINKEALVGLTSNKLNKVPGGLYALGLGEIPKPICIAIEKLYHVKHIYAIGFTWQGHLYGTASFIMREEKKIKNQRVIEGFIKQASIALQRKQVENKIKESEEKFRTLFENANDVIVYVDKHGKILDVNERVRDLIGYRIEEIKGKNLFKLKILEKTDLLTILKLFKNAVRSRKLKTNEGENVNIMELEFIHKNGTKVFVETNTRFIYKNSKIEGFLSIIRDTTKRKEADEKLHYQADLLQNVSDAIISTDLDFKIRTWNRAAENMYGWEAHEVVGKHLGKVTKSKYPCNQSEILKQIFEKGYWKGEVIQKRKDGTALNVYSSVCSIKDHAGNPVSTVAVNHDITEHKKAEDKIKASLMEKEVLLKEIHHRVKNNLQIISSLLNLQSKYFDDEKYRQFYRESQDRIKSMVLIHDKLYQSKDLTNINTSDYINGVSRYLFESYNVMSDSISLKTSIEDIAINIDAAIPCGLIINELISNALKYAFVKGFKDKKAEVKIKLCRDRGDSVKLIVSDNGVGFPNNLDFRSTKSLGLQLVCALVNQLDGNIKLDRSKGTAFTIKFKLAE